MRDYGQKLKLSKNVQKVFLKKRQKSAKNLLKPTQPAYIETGSAAKKRVILWRQISHYNFKVE